MFFNIEPINEVYIGKSKELLAIENQLDIFRNKYMGSYVINTHVNSDPDLLKFDRMMEDFFGLGCFTLKIINEPIVNGFTMPISWRYDVYGNNGSNVIVDKKGYKFKKEFDYTMLVCTYSGIIFNDNFTTEEIMAMILHEVGHNFGACISGPHGALIDIYITFGLIIDIILLLYGRPLGLIKNTNWYRSFADRLGKKWRQDGVFMVKLYDILKQIESIISTGHYAINDLIRVLSMGGLYLLAASQIVLNVVKNPLSKIFLPLRYREEKIADNFATIYGYGAATVSLQAKFESKAVDSPSLIMNTVNKIPFISTLIHTAELPSLLIITALDEHPAGVTRCKDQLALLKREVQKEDLDPKMKKVILADIKECEKQIEKISDTSKGIKDPYLAKHMYNKFLMSTNATLKDILIDRGDRFRDYDNFYNDNI